MFYYYVDYKKAFNNDKEYWVQVAMRMDCMEAIKILNKYGSKGYEVRLQKCEEDRHFTMEECQK